MRARGTILVVAAAALAAAAVVAVRAATDDSAGAQPDGAIPGDALPDDVGVVEYVVDGDTIDVSIGGTEERVRLIGIDTPEIAHDDGSPAECFGADAAGFTARLLPVGTEVRLVRDVVGRDDYDRLLAYVFRRVDDVFVNEAIVAGGYARPLTIEPNDAFAAQLVAAATAAESSGLGLWTACSG
jgi:micrococcal nuclease